ncbi:MAG: TolC family protein [Gemmatimonadetes bacterium]|nr:TolC family protein [Gemmatimonadota bacterium]
MPDRSRRNSLAWGAAALTALAFFAAPLAAQGGGTTPATAPAQAQGTAPRALSLQEALQMGAASSEQIEISRAGITRSRADVIRAQAARLPQLNGSASYSRTLASQFQGLGGGSSQPDTTTQPTGCGGTFTPNPALPLQQRVDSLENAVRCSGQGSGLGGLNFGNLGFGSENTYNFGFALSQPLFTGGRLTAQTRIARSGQAVAEIGVQSATAQTQLDVTQAYYDAQLADRMVDIAEATLAQAETVLRLAEVGGRVGQQSEFDVLRARVARDNQRPNVIQRRADREIAYTRLKQLLNIPVSQPLTLTSTLEEVAPVAVADTSAGARAVVRQAAEQVRVQQAQVTIAHAQRLPSVSLTSQYGRVAYPGSILPSWSDFRENWTVGAALQVPIFTGGRIRGDELAAQANVEQAQAQLQQVRELAELDTRNAFSQLDAARATWESSSGTVEQAQRAYQIAELRYREGLSNQLELTDARILLEQARANRALAARNLQIAQTRVRLLPNLPLGSTGGASASASGGATTQGSTTQSSATTQTQQTQGAAGQTGAAQGTTGGTGLPTGA